MPWFENQLNMLKKKSGVSSLALNPEESAPSEVNTDVKTS